LGNHDSRGGERQLDTPCLPQQHPEGPSTSEQVQQRDTADRYHRTCGVIHVFLPLMRLDDHGRDFSLPSMGLG
jgi:hypothetical protein